MRSGFRISLALAGVPAIVLTIGGILLPDTPNSLVDRGYPQDARKVLEKVRGTKDVDEEFDDIVRASEVRITTTDFNNDNISYESYTFSVRGANRN
jgi:hypothetical protein